MVGIIIIRHHNDSAWPAQATTTTGGESGAPIWLDVKRDPKYTPFLPKDLAEALAEWLQTKLEE